MFKRHLIVWLLVTACLIGYTVFFNKTLIVDQVVKEQKYIKNTMGTSSFDRIQKNANITFSFCCNWLASITYSVFVPKYEDDEGLRESMARSHEGFWTSVYLLTIRFFVFIEWLVVFLAIFFASFYQGLVKRSISVTNMAWSSPIRYHLGLHYALAVIGVSVNYLLFPVALNPYVAVLLLTVFSFVLYVIASNIQPKV